MMALTQQLRLDRILQVARRVTDWSSAPPQSDWALAIRVAANTASLRDLSDTALAEHAESLRLRVRQGIELNAEDIVERGFSLVNESLRRSLGFEYYPVQFVAARALIRAEIAEMATGEGKTLVQGLAAFVLSLPGRGVHVMTSNAFLAERDYDQLAPILSRLGLSVGLLRPQADPAEKREAYGADVTYGPGYEFGFDYLRDQIGRPAPQVLGASLRAGAETNREVPQLQRGHVAAIVDEADSVMIDEATTPLCLSMEDRAGGALSAAYLLADDLAATLEQQKHFLVDVRRRTANLTEAGQTLTKAGDVLPERYQLERPWQVYIEQALTARHIFQRDVDYVVQEGRAVLVDQSTGRLFADRTLQNGLHQAIEAKERIEITPPRHTQARVSRQQFLLLYETLSGMTGTAQSARRELRKIYRRRVRVIPTRKPSRRVVLATRYFGTESAKFRAIVADVKERNETGQPVLVGTRTIDESVELGKLLAAAGVSFELLNGTQDRDEAEIIARAGQVGAVTIATNLAGRGTDIRPGDGVEMLGGLHVIATERHLSARVDRQLIGRTARQGDPGSCQTYVSAEDELIAVHNRTLGRTMRRLAGRDGSILCDLSGSVGRAQRRVERRHFEQRRQLLQQGAWLENVLSKVAGT